MELRPPDPPSARDAGATADEPRGDWVAEVLGDAWKTEGDGIYRYVSEPDERERPSTDR